MIIEELPEDTQIASMREKPTDNKTISGLTVSDVDEEMKKNLNIYGGVKVDKISSKQLNESKIQVNDIITHINNQPIFNVKDFSKKIKNVKDNSLANLLVYRNSTPVYLAIKISK